MKNMSELMVDLAYSAVLFNSKGAAEEVLKLENRVNSMNYEVKKQLITNNTKSKIEFLNSLLSILKH